MARRRYVSTNVSVDKVLNRLARESDFAALFYMMMIPHADDEATLIGDPDELLATVLPGRRDKDTADVIAAIEAMLTAELLEGWDREKGIIYFPVESFYKYQTYIPEGKRRKWRYGSAPIPVPQPPAQNSDKSGSVPIIAEERRESPEIAAYPSVSPSPSVSVSPSVSPSVTRQPPIADLGQVRGEQDGRTDDSKDKCEEKQRDDSVSRYPPGWDDAERLPPETLLTRFRGSVLCDPAWEIHLADILKRGTKRKQPESVYLRSAVLRILRGDEPRPDEVATAEKQREQERIKARDRKPDRLPVPADWLPDADTEMARKLAGYAFLSLQKNIPDITPLDDRVRDESRRVWDEMQKNQSSPAPATAERPPNSVGGIMSKIRFPNQPPKNTTGDYSAKAGSAEGAG
jgi:hypothetical protein